MTVEEWLLRQEGLDPLKVKNILDNVSYLLSVIETELPRIKQLIGDVRMEIAAYEAKQAQWR